MGGPKRATRTGGRKQVVFADDDSQPSQMADDGSQCSQAPISTQEGGVTHASRFRHLIDPIRSVFSCRLLSSYNNPCERNFFADRLLRRDLALNWNVDIAKELEQYLNEVELIEISFDEGGTALNFAEAALLIQGSTCVYSRKVEYLYQLVFRVLDIIADRQRKLDGPEGAENNEDPDAAFPDEPEFISLDDIQAAKRSAIDMVEKEGGENEADNTIMVRSPVILMQINIESDLESDDPNKDFKLASAAVHSSGALLLEPRYQSMLDNSLQVSYLVSSLVRTSA